MADGSSVITDDDLHASLETARREAVCTFAGVCKCLAQGLDQEPCEYFLNAASAPNRTADSAPGSVTAVPADSGVRSFNLDACFAMAGGLEG